MKVLCIDGPYAGKIHDSRGSHRVYAISSPSGPHELLYYIHHFVLLNRTIRLASIHPAVEDINLNEVYELIASALVKGVSQ
jgi:hypothetical protein